MIQSQEINDKFKTLEKIGKNRGLFLANVCQFVISPFLNIMDTEKVSKISK